MARHWREVRDEATRSGQLDEGRMTEHKEHARSRVRAQRLADIRTANGVNQSTLAERLHISQPRVSRIERGDLDHTQLATLRAYIQALGGELEVTAKFGDERITVG